MERVETRLESEESWNILTNRLAKHTVYRSLSDFPMTENVPLRIVEDNGNFQRGFIVMTTDCRLIPDRCPRDAFLGVDRISNGIELLTWLASQGVTTNDIAGILEYQSEKNSFSVVLWEREK